MTRHGKPNNTSGYTEAGHIPKKQGAESDIFKRGLSLNLASTAIASQLEPSSVC